jgi:hypothetical protein
MSPIVEKGLASALCNTINHQISISLQIDKGRACARPSTVLRLLSIFDKAGWSLPLSATSWLAISTDLRPWKLIILQKIGLNITERKDFVKPFGYLYRKAGPIFNFKAKALRVLTSLFGKVFGLPDKKAKVMILAYDSSLSRLKNAS